MCWMGDWTRSWTRSGAPVARSSSVATEAAPPRVRAERLAQAVRALRGIVADPRAEAVRIWAGLDGLTPGEQFVRDQDAVPDPATLRRFDHAVARRIRGEPLAYVVGWTGFRHLTIATDRRALIPRPETEGLVERVLARVSGGVVADVGTGSGCIALSLLHEGRYRAVIATDRSAAALALARENAARLQLAPTFLRGDLTAPLAGGSLDARS